MVKVVFGERKDDFERDDGRDWGFNGNCVWWSTTRCSKHFAAKWWGRVVGRGKGGVEGEMRRQKCLLDKGFKVHHQKSDPVCDATAWLPILNL